jgi:hypothetical protein
MNDKNERKPGLILSGLDGSNPLAFLAALGTLRTLSLAWPDRNVQMSWVQQNGAWRPRILTDGGAKDSEVINALHDRMQCMVDHPAFHLGDNLAVSAAQFREYVVGATQSTHANSERAWTDFAAAFGSEATVTIDAKKKPIIQDTFFRTMSGAGHQHFLQFMRNILANSKPAHLEKALLRPWQYDDPVANQTMRWDPIDEAPYALRWRDPSGDPARQLRGTMLGANALAIMGLPMMPSFPTLSGLRTVGFTGARASDTYLVWPIWASFVGAETCKSLLAHVALMVSATDTDAAKRATAAQELTRMGVVGRFRSRRVTIGKFRNFTPAEALT